MTVWNRFSGTFVRFDVRDAAFGIAIFGALQVKRTVRQIADTYEFLDRTFY